MEQNREPQRYSQLIFDKGTKPIWWDSTISSTNGAGTIGQQVPKKKSKKDIFHKT